MFGKLEHPVRFKPEIYYSGDESYVDLQNVVGTIKFLDDDEGRLAEDLLSKNLIAFEPSGYFTTDDETGERKFTITALDIVRKK